MKGSFLQGFGEVFNIVRGNHLAETLKSCKGLLVIACMLRPCQISNHTFACSAYAEYEKVALFITAESCHFFNPGIKFFIVLADVPAHPEPVEENLLGLFLFFVAAQQLKCFGNIVSCKPYHTACTVHLNMFFVFEIS